MRKLFIFIIIIAIALYLFGVFDGKTEIEDVVIEENLEEEVLIDEVEISEGTKDVDTENSILTWVGIRKIGNVEHIGRTPISSGFLFYGEDSLESIELVFDMINMSATDGSPEAFINDLKSGNFFEVETYPEASFTSTSIEKTESGFDLTGDLILKDSTNEISFSIVSEEDGKVVVYSGDLEIDRTLWGVTFGSKNFFEDLGDAVIEDMVQISFEIVV